MSKLLLRSRYVSWALAALVAGGSSYFAWGLASRSTLAGERRSKTLDLSAVRSIDGVDRADGVGATHTQLRRTAPADYPDDGSGETIIGDSDRANPRTVSNLVAADGDLAGNARDMTNTLWLWGQFIDHDLDLTESHVDNGTADVFSEDPNDVILVIPFNRSNFDPATSLPGVPRQQVNEITAFIDASNVYGSDEFTAQSLRDPSGGGRLLLDENGLLPTDDGGSFRAGDIRANENVALTSMHTLFVREHNRLAARIAREYPDAGDEEIYQLARKIVGAELQIITYEEFLPALLGPYAPRLKDVDRFDPGVDPAIANEFSTAFFRFGHSLLPAQLPLADGGSIALRDAFFQPSLIANDPELVEQLLVGFAATECREFDTRIVDDVRNFLFPEFPGAFGLDLASLNIQRGRDHGLPDYNTLRVAYGLDPVVDFSDITSDVDLQLTLFAVYGSVDNIDPWVGGLSEDPLPGASTGELVTTALIDQFVRVAVGDPFFHTNDVDLDRKTLDRVIKLKDVTLSRVIRWNTSADEVPRNVFLLGGGRNGKRDRR